ncbi:MAG: NAD-dependent epimerase/dehydratase family protein, partial [Candidatus Helarchaeota archaeon]
LGKQSGIRTIWARIFSVYGIYDKPTSMISQTLQRIIDREPTKFTDGKQLWDYLFSEDAGKAFYLLGEYGKDQTIYCVASGECRFLLDYLRKIESLLKPDIPLGIGEIPYPQNGVMNLCADISNLIEDTGFKPSNNFEEGIMKTYSYLKQNQSQ